MKRITIVGQPGGGKSILARLIGVRPGLPGHVLRSPRAVRRAVISWPTRQAVAASNPCMRPDSGASGRPLS